MLTCGCTTRCPEPTVQLWPQVILKLPGLQGSPAATGPSAAASGAELVLQAGASQAVAAANPSAAQQAASSEAEGPMQRFLGFIGWQAADQAQARWADAASRARGASSS